MQKYEIMYILKASLDDAARAAAMEEVVAPLKDNGATIDDVKEWGIREYAQPINDEPKGYYVILHVTSDEHALSEFKRKARVNPALVRQLITLVK